MTGREPGQPQTGDDIRICLQPKHRELEAECGRLREALDEALSYRRAGRMPHDVLERLREVSVGALRKERGDARVTHGRHCSCSACAREDWTNPRLGPCGMHGAGCPAEYAPITASGASAPEGRYPNQPMSLADERALRDLVRDSEYAAGRLREQLDAATEALKELVVLAEHGGWVLADDHSLGLVNEPAVARARAALGVGQ